MLDDDRNLITGYGEHNAFEFAIDFGGKYSLVEYALLSENGLWVQSFDVVVTVPNEYSIGRMAEAEKSAFHFDVETVRRFAFKEVKVTLEYVAEGSEEFKAMDPHKRNCYYPNEKALDVFRTYSEANCILECAWRIAKDECGCAPWFLLQHLPKTTRMCEAIGNRCFRNLVENRYNRRHYVNCKNECLSDCEKAQYYIEARDKIYNIYDQL